MSSGGAGAAYRPILAVVGASVSVLTIYAGNKPGPLLQTVTGTSLSAVVVFVALVAGGLWVLRTASAVGVAMGCRYRGCVGDGTTAGSAASHIRWARLAGCWHRTTSRGLSCTGSGLVWMVSCGLAALIGANDTHKLRSDPDAVVPNGLATRDGHRGPLARLVAALRAPDRGRRRNGLLVVMGILVLSRVPYLVVYWPGIVAFDTFRGYAYARGTSPWETYDPVGHSLLITAMQWSGTTLGWGDAGGVAIGAITVVLASSAAFTFMLGRMAVWGLQSGSLGSGARLAGAAAGLRVLQRAVGQGRALLHRHGRLPHLHRRSRRSAD